jgi:hypothetical protein
MLLIWRHSVLIECAIHIKLIRLIKICFLNETCSKVHIGQYLSNAFLIQIGLKQGND